MSSALSTVPVTFTELTNVRDYDLLAMAISEEA
jgi:hypothetical protein